MQTCTDSLEIEEKNTYFYDAKIKKQQTTTLQFYYHSAGPCVVPTKCKPNATKCGFFRTFHSCSLNLFQNLIRGLIACFWCARPRGARKISSTPNLRCSKMWARLTCWVLFEVNNEICVHNSSCISHSFAYHRRNSFPSCSVFPLCCHHVYIGLLW